MHSTRGQPGRLTCARCWSIEAGHGTCRHHCHLAHCRQAHSEAPDWRAAQRPGHLGPANPHGGGTSWPLVLAPRPLTVSTSPHSRHSHSHQDHPHHHHPHPRAPWGSSRVADRTCRPPLPLGTPRARVPWRPWVEGEGVEGEGEVGVAEAGVTATPAVGCPHPRPRRGAGVGHGQAPRGHHYHHHPRCHEDHRPGDGQGVLMTHTHGPGAACGSPGRRHPRLPPGWVTPGS